MSSSLSFFGKLGVNARVSVVPTRLWATALQSEVACAVPLREHCSALPELTRRAWLWSGLSIHDQGETAVVDSILAWASSALHAKGKRQARVASLRAAERYRWSSEQCSAERLLDFFRRTVDPQSPGFREQSVHFGCIGQEAIFSVALHWQEVPGFVDDLCRFIRATPVPTLASIITVFRQLVLIHPFLDGNGRLARGLAAASCAEGGWPRYLLLPALLAFRASADARDAYSLALAASSPERFIAYVLAKTEAAVDAIRNQVGQALTIQDELAEALAAASFARRMQTRLVAAPCISTTEFASIAGSSERNALRWLARLSTQGLFTPHGDHWLWAPAVTYYQVLDARIRAVIDTGSPRGRGTA